MQRNTTLYYLSQKSFHFCFSGNKNIWIFVPKTIKMLTFFPVSCTFDKCQYHICLKVNNLWHFRKPTECFLKSADALIQFVALIIQNRNEVSIFTCNFGGAGGVRHICCWSKSYANFKWVMPPTVKTLVVLLQHFCDFAYLWKCKMQSLLFCSPL